MGTPVKDKNLTDGDIKIVADVIKERIYVPLYEKKITVFLCGADLKQKNKGRAKVAKLFKEYSKYEILYPEDLFEELLAGQGQYSLLSLENILADSVDVVVIIPESPGSFAELGAFSNNNKLVKKLICISQNKYKNDKSFINYGPYRLVKEGKTGKILHFNFNEFEKPIEAKKIFRKIHENVLKIRRITPTEKGVANILESENFILPCIYLIDYLNNLDLYKLLEQATKKDIKLCEISVKAAIGRLLNKRHITRTTIGYKVTVEGALHIQRMFPHSYLDKLRVETLNVQNRRNAAISYDRIIGAHL
ncbi:hypothetical protein FDP61_09345 [Enterobacter ludwigii]|jgi:hypothetical protein|nr:retron St85 family effector protein [Enterobacter ludwigii]MRI49546.1 hypothetical protein [Enterobacter ludwigii]